MELERDALACSGIKSAGRCRALALVAAYGVQGTPRARIVRETIRAWFDLLRICDAKILSDLRVAWFKALHTLNEDNHEKHIHGIMTNLISLLLKAKWTPKNMLCWIAANGDTWVMSGTEVAPDVVAAAINKDLFSIELERAAQHYNGKGLGDGIHYDATVAVMRNLKPNQYNIRCLLETIISGATWPAQRIHELHADFPGICPRCGREPETALHCYWTCAANSNIQEAAVQDSQDLVNTAREKSDDNPCLWLRGILPKRFVSIPLEESPVKTSTITWINRDHAHLGTGVYYGDASGGENTKYPDIRRVGCAFAVIDSNGALVYAARFPLPGEVQTVSRGELFALVVLIRQAQNLSEIEFITDNKGVRDKFNKGPKEAYKSVNCDLFAELFQTTIDKGIRLKVRWMPSHLKESDARPENVSELDVKGNALADLYAGEAAKEVQVSLSVSAECIYYYNLVKRIQWRIISIIVNLPARTKYRTVMTPKEIAQTLEDKCTESSHVLERHGDRFTCTRCLDSFRSKDPAFQHWLAGICIEVVSGSRPNPIDHHLHVGNQYVHFTHSLTVHRGLVYCSKCGSRSGSNQIRLLAKACEPPSDYGHNTLKAISLDRLPQGLDEWPDLL